MLTQSIPQGIITFWSLAPHTDRQLLLATCNSIDGIIQHEMVAAGNAPPKPYTHYEDSVPQPRDLAGMMQDVLRGVFSGRDGFRVIALRKGKGWVVKQEVQTDDDVYWNSVCHVVVSDKDSQGGTVEPFYTVKHRRGVDANTADWQLLDAIDKQVEVQKGLLTAEQVSVFMTNALRDLPGTITLRPSGGIYALTDKHAQKRWNQLADAVMHSAAGGKKSKVYRIDYEINEGSIEAIRDALLEEASAFASNLQAEIMEADPEKQLGARAMRNREKQAARMLERVEHLERALGTRLQEVSDVVGGAKTLAGQAAMLSSVSVG